MRLLRQSSLFTDSEDLGYKMRRKVVLQGRRLALGVGRTNAVMPQFSNKINKQSMIFCK